MNTSGTYSEQLPCGGKLKVCTQSWEIEYYFAGPDLRYNGTFVRIPGASVSEYIRAYRENWNEYKRLKANMIERGEFHKNGKSGMTIWVGGYIDGVCLQYHHMPLRTEESLNKLIASYEYAIGRAKAVQDLMKDL